MKSTSLIKILFGLAIATIFLVAFVAIGKAIVDSGVMENLKPSPSPSIEQESSNNTVGQLDLGTYVQPDAPVNILDYFYYTDLPAEVRSKMIGSTYPKVSDGAMVPLEDLAYVKLKYVDFDGNDKDGELVCHKVVASELVDIFYKLYEAKYPLELVTLADEFHADDIKSMEADNTSCFNYRFITGSTTLSNHSYGLAVDINPIYNPYVKKKADGSDYISPAAGKPYVSDRTGEYCITENDLAYKLFTEHGWGWGGHYKSLKDYMHFEKDPAILSAAEVKPDTEKPEQTDSELPQETVITTDGVISIDGQLALPSQKPITPGQPGSGRDLVVVIDPGHGGTNEGSDYGVKEKYLNMKVAAAMKAQLEFYDGVKVYLTHSSAEDNMTIESRLDYAKSVNADLFVSCHFNASETHDKWGAEVWIPQDGEVNRVSYGFARTVMSEWQALGLHNRGIKTRSGNQGEYYGVLRFGKQYGIPSVILEHAHVDNALDSSFVSSDLALAKFGQADANAVAKYFGLTSARMDVSYDGVVSNYKNSELTYAPEDTTPPQVVIDSVSVKDGKLIVEATATDSQSPIMMYSYSTDGGKTFSAPQSWPESSAYNINSPTSMVLTISRSTHSGVVVRAYNLYDCIGESAVFR